MVNRARTPPDGQAWLEPIERLVSIATREVRLLAALTPVGAEVERARLVLDLLAKRPPVPRWTYAPRAHGELLRVLDAAERTLDRGAETPLEHVYLARVRELSLEAALCAAAGTEEIGALARRRFAPDLRAARAASELARVWLEEPAVPPGGVTVVSDDPDTRSLLSQLRAAVGELRLPFSVHTQPSLAPLAATGEHVILVAPGRLVHDEDARRTVLHEIEGHARPRARSQRSPVALLRAGTARGIDHQEGRALLLEERAGFLGSRRKRQLAVRHRAVEAMLAGASFTDVALLLVNSHGVDAPEAIVVAERVFRGSDGKRPGLGRERVYLESFLRVRDHLAANPNDEDVLASGQIAVDAIDTLRPFTSPARAR
ncbi:MAG: tyrosine/phenylalanine carboxypeptidase domain-containing protein [Polyangiaceae bacterium]